MTQLTFVILVTRLKIKLKLQKSDVKNNDARLCASFLPTAEDKPNFNANSPCRAVPCRVEVLPP
jgi:hypothetical protein